MDRRSFAARARALTGDSLGGRESLRFARWVSLLSAVAAVALVGVAAAAMARGGAQLNEMAAVSAQAGLTAFSAAATGVYLLLAAAVIGIVASGLGAAAALKDNRRLAYAYAALQLAAAGMAVAGSLGLLGTLSDLDTALCEDGCTPVDAGFTAQQTDLLTQSIAMFDECCLARHSEWDAAAEALTAELGVDSIELLARRIQPASFGVCPVVGSRSEVYAQNCEDAIPPIVRSIDVLSGLVPKLCTCAPSEGSFGRATSAVKNSNVCKALETATITLDSSVRIPTLTVSLLSVIVPNYGDFFDANPDLAKSIDVPLVGSPAPPLKPEAFPNGGLGCGLGMTKPFVWYVRLYLGEVWGSTAIAGFAFGTAAAICACLMAAFLAMTTSADASLAVLQYGDLEHSNKSKLAVESVGPAGLGSEHSQHSTTSSSRSQKTAPTRRSDDSASSGGRPARPNRTSQIIATRHDRDALEARLADFYEQHEPTKVVHGQVDAAVVNFGLAKGVGVLNAKLKQKYGQDLDDFEALREVLQAVQAAELVEAEIATTPPPLPLEEDLEAARASVRRKEQAAAARAATLQSQPPPPPVSETDKPRPSMTQVLADDIDGLI